jgi:hypothetical protein
MNKRTISGKLFKGPPAGYCTNEIHKGYMTEYLLEKHKCIGRRCKYLIGLNGHNSTYLRIKPKKRNRQRKDKPTG